MSLINDALNRARAEAARREADHRGEPPTPLTAPRRSSRPSPATWAVGGVILLALLGWLWAAGGRSQKTLGREVGGTGTSNAEPSDASSAGADRPETGLAPPDRGAVVADPLESPSTAPQPYPEERPPAQPANPAAAEGSPSTSRRDRGSLTADPSEPAPAAPQPYPEERPPAQPAIPAAAESSPSTSRRDRGTLTVDPSESAPAAPQPYPEERRTAQPATSAAVESPPSVDVQDAASPAAVWPADGENGETWYYVGAFTVPGGGSIELGGIAWSAAAPSAMLNGSLLKVGDEILGLTIAEIAPRTVVLEGHGQRVALQLGSAAP